MARVTVLRSSSAPVEPGPPLVTSGRGVRLFLADGRSVIDASNTTALLGHAHPALVAAMKTAAAHPVVSDMWGWREREEAAHDLIDIAFAGESTFTGVRFVLSGGEANDQALSLAQALTGRRPLVARSGAYHGGVGLARDVTLESQWHGGLAFVDGGVRAVPRATVVRELPLPACALVTNDAVCEDCTCDRQIGGHLNGAAGAILDNTQGGAYPSGRYQDRLAGECAAAGCLWIADEVVTGLGRSGRWFAFQRGESRPHIVTLGKGLTGGAAPGAAIVLSSELMDVLDRARWQSYGTLRGHPAALAALRATLHTIRSEGLVERANELHELFARGLRDLADRHPCVAGVVGEGGHWTVRLRLIDGPQADGWGGDGSEPPVSARVSSWALERDVLLGTSSEPNMVFIAPPLIIEDSEIQAVLDALDHALSQADRLHTMPVDVHRSH